MVPILSFLIERAQFVYEFFGSLYQRRRDWLISGRDWVLSEINRWWNEVIRRLGDVWNDVNYSLSLLQKRFDTVVSSIRNDLLGFILEQISIIQAWVSHFVDSVINPIKNLINQVWQDAVHFVSDKWVQLKQYVDLHTDDLLQKITPFIPFYPLIVSLSNLFNETNRTKITTLLGSLYNTLLIFVQNPLNFIGSLMYSIIIDLVCYGFAYALGTTKYPLPPLPSWGGTGYGGGFIPGNPPPPGASGLVNPLSPLWVSGYIFAPGHLATDFGCQSNQPVYACHSGTVIVSGWSNVGYGFYVVIQGDDWYSLYAHLATPAAAVNQVVNAGDVIGYGDSTGNSTGNHLHLELRYKGAPIDPLTVLTLGA